MQDFRFALRSLRARPTFAGAAVLTLALGIAVTGTVISVAQVALLPEMPFDRPAELVNIWGTSSVFGVEREIVSGPNFVDLRNRNDVLAEVAAYKTDGATLYTDGVPVTTDGLLVSPAFFDVLRVTPHLGRTFDPTDGSIGSDPSVIISFGLWQRHFGSDRNVVGRQLETFDSDFTVVGVLPERFRFTYPSDVVFPIGYDVLQNFSRTSINYWMIGRLGPAVTVDHAQANLSTIMADLRSAFPNLRDWDVALDRMKETMVEPVRPAVLLLLGGAVILFLIACANVGSLLLARGIGRSAELAVRTSLGASPMRIVRLILSEALVLGVAAGVVGTGIAAFAVRQLPYVLPQSVAVPGSASASVLLPAPSLDWHVVGATMFFALLAVGLAGLVPALRATRTDIGTLVRAGSSRASASRRSLASLHAIVFGQLALTVMLLAIAGVTLLSTTRLLERDSGLDPTNVLTLYFGNLDAWPDGQRATYYGQVLDAVRDVPGVDAVGINDYVPLQQEDDFKGITIERGMDVVRNRAEWRRVSAGYFSASGVRAIRGRLFTEADDDRAPSVTVINEAMAEAFWPGQDPIGRRVLIHERVYASSEIVGVVRNVRRRGLDQDAPPVMYVPYHRKPRPVVAMFVRAEIPTNAVLAPVQQAIWSVDSRQPIERINTLSQVVTNSVAIPRLILLLVWIAAVAALVLATVGVYGVMAYAVSHRHREIGIRMALGATRQRVGASVVWAGVRLGLIAVAVGSPLAFAAARVAGSVLFQVRPAEPTPYVGAAALVLVVVGLACYLPARRVTRIDVLTTLKSE